MRTHRRWTSAVVLLIGVASLSGCLRADGDGATGATASTSGSFGHASPRGVPAGTQIAVRLKSNISSETAQVGDTWSGVLVEPVTSGSREVVSAGSPVRGVVTGALGAKRGSRAMLELAVQEIAIDGNGYDVHAMAEPVIAGSPRARNLGAIAGGAAAGALIGKAIGGDVKDAAVGGLVGGGVATGLVAASKGYQVVLKPGTVMTFTVSSRS